MDTKLLSVRDELTTLIDVKVSAVRTELSLKYDEQIADLKATVKQVRVDLADDKFNLLDLEIHGRKRNCLVTNLKESETPRNESFEELTQKFKDSLINTVRMPPSLVNAMTFNAAHRLGSLNESTFRTKPRTAIVVFDNLHHIQALWGATKKLGTAAHSYKTQLPRVLATYRSHLLKKRSDLMKQHVKARVWENHGYPTMDIYDNAAKKFVFEESFLSIHGRK